jgi:hypothetical protein
MPRHLIQLIRNGAAPRSKNRAPLKPKMAESGQNRIAGEPGKPNENTIAQGHCDRRLPTPTRSFESAAASVRSCQKLPIESSEADRNEGTSCIAIPFLTS